MIVESCEATVKSKSRLNRFCLSILDLQPLVEKR